MRQSKQDTRENGILFMKKIEPVENGFGSPSKKNSEEMVNKYIPKKTRFR